MVNIANYREMQIKAIMKYQVTPVRMVVTNKSKNKCWSGCEIKGTVVHFLCDCKLVKPLRKTMWRFLNKLKTELTDQPIIPLVGI